MKRVIQRVKVAYGDWQKTIAILKILYRRDELEQLVEWAKRKRFSYPLQNYRNRLADIEVLVNRYMLQYPNLMRWARWLQFLHQAVRPSPNYYSKGSAVKYNNKYYRM
jgi:hypothetical protein